jgi:hypothetical protein
MPRRANAAEGDLPLAAIRLIERRAFTRAADIAKSYAEKYEPEDRTTPQTPPHQKRRLVSRD